MGLTEGESLPSRPSEGLPFLDMGVLKLLPLRLAGERFRGVGERGYRGGVMYSVPGVAGGVALGSRPKSALCLGVKGMSATSSWDLMRGRSDIEMLYNPSRQSKNSIGFVIGCRF